MSDVKQPLNNRKMIVSFSDKAVVVILLKGCLGTGLLSLPINFYKMGYLNGAFWTLLIGTIFVACTHSLINNFRIVKDRYSLPFVRFGDAMKMTMEDGPPCLQPYANVFKFLTNIFLWMLQFGICCVYVIFVSDNIRQIVQTVWKVDIDDRIFMFCLIPFLTLTFLRLHLRYVVKFILAANISLILGFIFLVPYLVSDLSPLSERKAYKDLKYVPHFYGNLLFSINSVGMFLTVEQYMRYPKNFGGWTGIFNRVMCFVIPLNIALGILGYWRFGNEMTSSISLVLPQDDPVALFVKGCFALSVFFTYTPQGLVCIDLIYTHYIHNEPDRSLEMMVRLIFVLATVLLDMLFSKLQIVISLVGVTLVSALSIVFPGIFDLCVRYPTGYGACYKWIFIDLMLIGIGTIMSVVGAYQCFLDIVDVYTN